LLCRFSRPIHIKGHPAVSLPIPASRVVFLGRQKMAGEQILQKLNRIRIAVKPLQKWIEIHKSTYSVKPLLRLIQTNKSKRQIQKSPPLGFSATACWLIAHVVGKSGLLFSGTSQQR